MNEQGKFELEEEPPKPPPPPPAPRPPTARAPLPEASDAPRIGKHRKRRLQRLIPSGAAAFLIVGWLAIGLENALLFPLVGAVLGAFAAWSRPGEYLLAIAGGVLGALAYFTGVGIWWPMVPNYAMVIAIAGGGVVGYAFGIDDRLRGA